MERLDSVLSERGLGWKIRVQKNGIKTHFISIFIKGARYKRLGL